jgi:hypothetical protein
LAVAVYVQREASVGESEAAPCSISVPSAVVMRTLTELTFTSSVATMLIACPIAPWYADTSICVICGGCRKSAVATLYADVPRACAAA